MISPIIKQKDYSSASPKSFQPKILLCETDMQQLSKEQSSKQHSSKVGEERQGLGAECDPKTSIAPSILNKFTFDYTDMRQKPNNPSNNSDFTAGNSIFPFDNIGTEPQSRTQIETRQIFKDSNYQHHLKSNSQLDQVKESEIGRADENNQGILEYGLKPFQMKQGTMRSPISFAKSESNSPNGCFINEGPGLNLPINRISARFNQHQNNSKTPKNVVARIDTNLQNGSSPKSSSSIKKIPSSKQIMISNNGEKKMQGVDKIFSPDKNPTNNKNTQMEEEYYLNRNYHQRSPLKVGQNFPKKEKKTNKVFKRSQTEPNEVIETQNSQKNPFLLKSILKLPCSQALNPQTAMQQKMTSLRSRNVKIDPIVHTENKSLQSILSNPSKSKVLHDFDVLDNRYLDYLYRNDEPQTSPPRKTLEIGREEISFPRSSTKEFPQFHK